MTIIKDERRQRLITAINHHEPDRIPLTLGSPSCSFHYRAQANLLSFLKLSHQSSPIITDNILQIVETDKRLFNLFNIDLIWLLPKESDVEWSPDKNKYKDDLGRIFVAGGGFFNQVDYPLKGDLDEEWELFKLPDLSQERFAHFGDQAMEFYNKGFGLGIDGPWGIFEISSSLIGLTEYLINLKTNPNLIRKIAEDVLENHLIPFYNYLLADTSQYVQVVGISDDLGTQTGLIFSPKLYREIFKPLHKRLIDHIHEITNAKVYLHSDGSIYPLIPDLIEIGVEGLNPVQYSAKDMDLDRLKKEFGKDLGFFGGVVENNVLSFSSPEEIRHLVKENISILKKGGGFIFAPIHNISQEVPPENIIALYEAGIEFGLY